MQTSSRPTPCSLNPHRLIDWIEIGGFVPIILFGLLAPANVGRAQSITVPNGTFSAAGNAATHGGVILGEYDGLFNAGPWSADTDAILGLLAAPTVTIGSGAGGNVSISGLTDGLTVPVVGSVVNNDATVYNNNIGTTFIAGRIYTLTADFSSATALTLTVLTEGGVGIGMRASGTDVASTLGNNLAINLLTGTSGTLSLTYTAQAADAGDSIGLTLFAGRSTGPGLVNLSVLGNITFDNVALSVAPVPEPAAYGALVGLLALGCVFTRRRPRPAK